MPQSVTSIRNNGRFSGRRHVGSGLLSSSGHGLGVFGARVALFVASGHGLGVFGVRVRDGKANFRRPDNKRAPQLHAAMLFHFAVSEGFVNEVQSRAGTLVLMISIAYFCSRSQVATLKIGPVLGHD